MMLNNEAHNTAEICGSNIALLHGRTDGRNNCHCDACDSQVALVSTECAVCMHVSMLNMHCTVGHHMDDACGRFTCHSPDS